MDLMTKAKSTGQSIEKHLKYHNSPPQWDDDKVFYLGGGNDYYSHRFDRSPKLTSLKHTFLRVYAEGSYMIKVSSEKDLITIGKALAPDINHIVPHNNGKMDIAIQRSSPISNSHLD